MRITTESIRAELQRLDGLREEAWANLNQMIGAANQLKMILDILERQEEDPPDPERNPAAPESIVTTDEALSV